MDSIKCPYCGKQVDVDKAIRHQTEEKIRLEQEEKARIKFEKQKTEEFAAKEKKIREEIESDNKEKEKELEKERNVRLELEKKLKKEHEEREKDKEKIRADTIKKTEDENRLKIKEKEIQLEEIRKVNEDLKRKLEQGSQQRQGEALELDLEEQLREIFKADEFVPIPKGIEGADIWQKVLFKGKVVGSILWETKRTKAWSKGWITKLKDDSAKVSATEAILVSKALPEKVTNFDRVNGVWITSYEHAISICRYVRFLITSIAHVKSSTNQTDEEWGKIRDYMLSDAFKHRMQAHFDGINAIRDGLDAEKRSTLLRWKKQESQIEKLDTNTTNFYGELRSIVSDLPKIEGVDLEYLPEGDEDTKSLF